MRILYIAMKYDYGNERRGLSFEETNFRSALEGMGHELLCFDFMERSKRVGQAGMRRELVAEAAALRPDLAFFCLFTDQLDIPTIEAVRREGRCPAINWFADDHWRFEGFSRHYAPAFDLAITTTADALPRYQELAHVNVHLSQWACNRYAYKQVTTELRHEITFVGQPHGDRPVTVRRLKAEGFPVECWGFGWPAGRLEHDGMVEVFASSRINLNLSNSTHLPGWRARAQRLLGKPALGERPSQIKGRNFEVPGCGGFLLTERVPHLERYFDFGREIAVFEGIDDLVEQTRYWLDHPHERAEVAEAGYQRVLAEHTYDHRFSAIFGELDMNPSV